MVGLNALFMCLLNTLIKMNAVIYARVSSIGDRQNTDRQNSAHALKGIPGRDNSRYNHQ